MHQKPQKYLEYRIIITPDARTGTKKRCFTAFVPVLGIATDGDTVEEAFENAESLIEFHLETLHKSKQIIPVEDSAQEFITTARVAVPS